MSVLDAFLTTSQNAQASFGNATPQPGTPYCESSNAALAAGDLIQTSPSTEWTGSAADAYTQANNHQIENIRTFAALDQRLATQIDSAAAVVTSGRENLLELHDRVVDLAELIPAGPVREFLLLPIVNAGIVQIGEIIRSSTQDLTSIGDVITEIAEEYRKLGGDDGTSPTPGEDPRKKLDDILRDYQVADDRKLPQWMITALTKVLGDERAGYAQLTVSEYRLLTELLATKGPGAVKDFFDIKAAAEQEAIQRFAPPAPGATSDNLTDAFRHTYWNALMTQRFGEEWTRKYATAHERRSGDPAPREAMDLYNNEIGRQIAMTHPDASPAELADLVHEAVRNGDTVIVSPDGWGLEWSKEGATGGNPDAPSGDHAPVNPPMPGNPTPYPTEGRTPGVPG